MYVGSRHVADMGRDIELDITPHLVEANGKIARGRWIDFGVLPNDLAYVTIDMYTKGFVQSRGGGNH